MQEGASLAFKKHLEEEARDLSGEAFSRFMDQLYDRISSLLESSDVAENLGALRAIDELIDVALGENASKVSRFSSYMRTVFEAKRDPEILVHASRVLGHLARAGGAMTADEVERQVTAPSLNLSICSLSLSLSPSELSVIFSFFLYLFRLKLHWIGLKGLESSIVVLPRS